MAGLERLGDAAVVGRGGRGSLVPGDGTHGQSYQRPRVVEGHGGEEGLVSRVVRTELLEVLGVAELVEEGVEEHVEHVEMASKSAPSHPIVRELNCESLAHHPVANFYPFQTCIIKAKKESGD